MATTPRGSAHPLTRNQTQSSLIAGAVAHTIFQTGWFLFGMSLAALVATALFGNIIGSITRSLGGDDPNAVLRALDGGSDLLFWVVLSFLIGSLILIGLAILVSGWMLSAAGLRGPWKVTMAAVGIAALVDIALFWIYVGLANLLTESRLAGPVLLTPVIALIGGILVGALIWWLMALTRREKIAAATATDAVTPAAAAAPADETA
ncbi:hypothetical protein [Microcella sp.]|uniref:hypothetical protein n=1 Tax=Microcella sp. TaxID=1913979 RepID=UPI003F704776